MSKLADRTTVYLDPVVKQFLQHKAIAEGGSVSEIINDHFADMLEDLEDIQEIKDARSEPRQSFDSLMSDLGLNYNDLRD
ncbi:CopG family transcriptional regulator [Candidatus Saccharibacteria bacterium]|nr:CopG family transcriptional regulator [Candidatus Saccharibacteria bacterium]